MFFNGFFVVFAVAGMLAAGNAPLMPTELDSHVLPPASKISVAEPATASAAADCVYAVGTAVTKLKKLSNGTTRAYLAASYSTSTGAYPLWQQQLDLRIRKNDGLWWWLGYGTTNSYGQTTIVVPTNYQNFQVGVTYKVASWFHGSWPYCSKFGASYVKVE